MTKYSYLISSELFISFCLIIVESTNASNKPLRSIEELVIEHEDDKNAMIALTQKDNTKVYEDFYDELDNWVQSDESMNIIFFGAPSSFLRLDPETILHILVHTKKYLIPISRVLLAWDIITDGKTAARLQGREYVAFGNLLNVVPEEDLYYVNFGDTSVKKFFAQTYLELNSHKLGILITAYRRYYGNTFYKNASDINELGYLFCGFPSEDLQMIKPSIFTEIGINILNKLEKCTVHQTEVLYSIATDTEAYGKPYKWSSHEISRLSTLFAYIPKHDISSIQLEAITAITPEIMKIMNQNKLEYFTKQQILRMNPKTRRIFVLRMQLKNSLDMNQLAKKYGLMITASFPLVSLSLYSVTLFLCQLLMDNL